MDSMSTVHRYSEASRPENRSLNRYRDVYPYDHSRVKLEQADTDYINASLVKVSGYLERDLEDPVRLFKSVKVPEMKSSHII